MVSLARPTVVFVVTHHLPWPVRGELRDQGRRGEFVPPGDADLLTHAVWRLR